MAPQQPTPSPSFANRVQVVTLTIYSTGSIAGSTGVPASSGGGSDVPIGAIAGGAAGGAMLAVAMVLIWKYWGLVIKRTEKRKRKEVQEILTVRENTRRNAATRFKPHSSLHPILGLGPEDRRVKFLTRTRRKNSIDSTAPATIPPTEPTEEKGTQETLTPADPGQTATATVPTDNGPRQPSLIRFAPAPVPRLVYEPWEPELKSESSREQQPEGGEETNSHPPEPAPEPTPTPTLSTSDGPSGRSNSPTPSCATSNRSSLSPARPSRSTRMRTPTRLPDPPDAPPMPVRGARRHSARPSSSTPSGSQQQTPISSPAASPRRPPSVLVTPPTSDSPVPPAVPSVPPGPVAVAAGSSSTSLPMPPPAIAISPVTWTSSPLHHSVLASDRPVIMPRAKNAQATSSPSDSQSQHTLVGSASHVSVVGNGEPSGRGGFPDSLRHADHSTATETTGENAQRVSRYSTPSAYSND